MKNARSRFVRGAILLLAGVLLAAAAVLVIVFAVLRHPTLLNGYGPILILVVVVAILAGLSAPSVLNAVALRRIAREHPGGLVFLAWRQPTLAPDLPAYLARKAITADVADRWVPALVDERGMSAWSPGMRPKELLLMEWSELGYIETRDFTQLQGRKRFGIAVDVRPFPTPLIVLVGHSALGIQGAFDRAGTQAVCDAANAMRPAASD